MFTRNSLVIDASFPESVKQPTTNTKEEYQCQKLTYNQQSVIHTANNRHVFSVKAPIQPMNATTNIIAPTAIAMMDGVT